MREMTDNDRMPFGKHKGAPMKEVPADYLLHIYEMEWLRDPLKGYISRNLKAIELEAKEQREHQARAGKSSAH